IIVSGAAGFIGSHMCDRLLLEGHSVIGVDNLLTGSMENISHLLSNSAFQFFQHDVNLPWTSDAPVDIVLHMASLASPKDYLAHPIETLDVGSAGTRNMLELARMHGARFLLTSTSECYGDPLVHPQSETYWGNVNPVGLRSCYASDLVDGLYRLMLSDERYPVNLGNPREMTILEFAELILKLTHSSSSIERRPLPEDDPRQRQPNITKAKRLLGWEPIVPLE